MRAELHNIFGQKTFSHESELKWWPCVLLSFVALMLAFVPSLVVFAAAYHLQAPADLPELGKKIDF